ncbi:DinB family protein [Lunatibacter salilacus]|uniref:DinB family protein n=1 Tax=Lunatibacter salilacus TaxID=2483804 RepID=UPI00131D48C2|nr:DinB family protein [Lunatibacter salilacus]
MPHIAKPNPMEYKPFYQGYIDILEGLSVHELLIDQISRLNRVFEDLSEEEIDLTPVPGKWSYNQVFGHLLDTEKIMHFRALMIARQPVVALPGFDQDLYVAAGNFVGKEILSGSMKSIIANREGIVAFLDTLRSEQLEHLGEVDGHPMSVRALIYIICGHMQHHLAGFYASRGWKL